MGSAIDLAQPGGVQVRVLLGGREGGVAEQLLDRPQVRPGLQQMRRERVAQGVRRDLRGKTRGAKPSLEKPRHGSRGQSPAPRVDEERLVFGVFPATQRRADRKIPGERFLRFFSERDDPLPSSLSRDARQP